MNELNTSGLDRVWAVLRLSNMLQLHLTCNPVTCVFFKKIQIQVVVRGFPGSYRLRDEDSSCDPSNGKIECETEQISSFFTQSLRILERSF